MEKNEIKKKRRLKFRFKLLLFIIIVITYALTIGTKGIFIKDIMITSKKIKNGLDGIKIIQISDLKYKSNLDKNSLESLIKKINKSKPDIVIFTGDLISKNYNITKKEKDYLTKELSKISARSAKLYIYGDEDFDDSKQILNSSSFTDVSGTEQIVYYKKSSISFVGIDNIKEYENGEHSSDIKVLLIHNPNDISKVKKYDFDIAMAGHTLNGQINIPKIKELFINGKYINAKYKVKNTTMYINPGLGYGRIKARLFNHPTIYLYRFKSA